MRFSSKQAFRITGNINDTRGQFGCLVSSSSREIEDRSFFRIHLKQMLEFFNLILLADTQLSFCNPVFL